MSVDIRGSLDNCVKCTVCETFCPVTAATPLFPGPKYAGPQSERYRRPGESVDASLDYCSGCGICTQVCPQGVDIAEINARARAEMKADRGMPLRDRVIARPTVLGRLAAAGRPGRERGHAHARRPPRRRGRRSASTATRPLPGLLAHDVPVVGAQAPHAGRQRRATVVYFHGCAANYNEPRRRPGWRSRCSSTMASA